MGFYNKCFVVILSWFVDQEAIHKAMDGNLIEKKFVECRPEKVSAAVLDDNVDVNLVRRYFSHVVEDVIERKKDMDLWICNVCQHELDGDNICESCLEWFHWQCVGVLSQPKSKEWFCRNCASK